MAALLRTLVPVATNLLLDVMEENFGLPSKATFERVEEARMDRGLVTFGFGPWDLEMQEIRPDEWRVTGSRDQ